MREEQTLLPTFNIDVAMGVLKVLQDNSRLLVLLGLQLLLVHRGVQRGVVNCHTVIHYYGLLFFVFNQAVLK